MPKFDPQRLERVLSDAEVARAELAGAREAADRLADRRADAQRQCDDIARDIERGPRWGRAGDTKVDLIPDKQRRLAEAQALVAARSAEYERAKARLAETASRLTPIIDLARACERYALGGSSAR